jgi:hypothetical protein
VRKRFKPPERNPRAVKRLADGTVVCLKNDAGRAEKLGRIRKAWRDQAGMCGRCGLELRLNDAQMERQEFRDEEVNRAIHKTCRDGYAAPANNLAGII